MRQKDWWAKATNFFWIGMVLLTYPSCLQGYQSVAHSSLDGPSKSVHRSCNWILNSCPPLRPLRDCELPVIKAQTTLAIASVLMPRVLCLGGSSSLFVFDLRWCDNFSFTSLECPRFCARHTTFVLLLLNGCLDVHLLWSSAGNQNSDLLHELT